MHSVEEARVASGTRWTVLAQPSHVCEISPQIRGFRLANADVAGSRSVSVAVKRVDVKDVCCLVQDPADVFFHA